MAINKQRLVLRFQEATGCTESKAQKHTQNYLWQCALAMLRDHFTDQAGARYYINQTQIQDTLNTIMVGGKRYYIWQTFQSFPERVFDIVQTGNNLIKEYSMAQSRYTMEEVLQQCGTPEELWNEVYKKHFAQEILDQQYDIAQIDLRSLNNYIKSNQAIDRAGKSPAQAQELDRNLKHAQKIHMLASAADGELIQIHSPSSFGRKYYSGPNLQNTPKIVRHAALGNCHEYDIESSVFAWKLSRIRKIAQEHNTTVSMPATLEYLDHKSAIRRRLAQAVFGSTEPGYINIIKEFITAIGFGAPLRGVGYVADQKYQKPALSQIITAKTKLDLAMQDSWVKQFYDEQTEMNDVLVVLAKITMLDELQAVPELWDKSGTRLKTNSLVSYLYQHAEREILDWAEQFCASSDVLLTVHDCIYTRHPIDLVEFRVGLRQHGEYFKCSHEQHRAYTWEDPVSPSDPFYDPRDYRKPPVASGVHSKEGFQDGSGYVEADYDPDLDPWLEQNP